MTFNNARLKMKKIANGRYHSLRYELTILSSGNQEIECILYLDPRIQVSAPTWREAFQKLMLVLKPESKEVDLSEQPEEELTT